MLTRRGLGLLGAAAVVVAGGVVAALTGSGDDPSPVTSAVPLSAPAAATPAQGTPAASVVPPSSAPPSSSAGPPSPSPTATQPQVVQAGSGRLQVVAGGSERSGPGPLRTYRVQVEGGLGIDAADFAAQVDRTLADRRSWGAGDRLSFRRVDSADVDFTVVLASPDTADRLCRPLQTAGIYSCGVGSTAVINEMRWLDGADAYEGQLPAYRQYVVNHEVGHVLGHRHEQCPGKGEPAPVMVQQTKGVGACVAQPWPYA